MGTGKIPAGGKEAENSEATKTQAPLEGAESEVVRLTALVETLKNESLRARADYDNLRKRVERERQEYKANANESLILDLLDVYEDLGRALDASKKPDAQAAQISKGLEMVHGQMKAVLCRYGLSQLEAVGKKFDPRTMEAIMQETSSDKEDDTVLEEFQRGYTLGSKVIRCSKVKVSKR